MNARARVPRASDQEPSSPLPKAVTDRTDRLVEVVGHCAAAKDIAAAAGEDFLVYLLSMAIVETQGAMRRATLGTPPPTRKRPRKPD